MNSYSYISTAHIKEPYFKHDMTHKAPTNMARSNYIQITLLCRKLIKSVRLSAKWLQTSSLRSSINSLLLNCWWNYKFDVGERWDYSERCLGKKYQRTNRIYFKATNKFNEIWWKYFLKGRVLNNRIKQLAL